MQCDVNLAMSSVERALFTSIAELCLHFESGGTGFVQNVGKFLPDYSVSHPRVCFFHNNFSLC